MSRRERLPFVGTGTFSNKPASLVADGWVNGELRILVHEELGHRSCHVHLGQPAVRELHRYLGALLREMRKSDVQLEGEVIDGQSD